MSLARGNSGLKSGEIDFKRSQSIPRHQGCERSALPRGHGGGATCTYPGCVKQAKLRLAGKCYRGGATT
ncbi:hypothetical protein PR003_g19737 [Phytophthora rubi]|uniref:Uncharacterized protein n=1 Tax=Phytophthora rubi TaxID=129364 RepID=A0A6A4DTJ7_9STRA|nr:hypothetical protein PR003_g19737 [Phytophthora rubi]